MSKAGYELTTGAAAIALAPATAKSVLCVIAPAQFGVDLVSYEISFDGVTSSNVPALVELCTSTLATNSTPGTNNTTGTVNQIYGRSITAGFTGFFNSTTEPTVLTPFKSHLVTVVGGLLIRDFQVPQTPDTAVSNGFVMRVTAPAAVNCRAAFRFERC